MNQQPRLAAILTTNFPYSHADVMVSKFLRGIPSDQPTRRTPRARVATCYMDQIDPRDIMQGLCFRHGVRWCQSIREALRDADGRLAVEGVLLIGEHGDYPCDELGRQLYPRRYFLEQIAGVFAECGAVCPVFCDKGLGHCWEDARWMVDRARELGVPLMAGSSLPVAWRRPFVEPALGCGLDAAVTVAYGEAERYGFHAVELLQAFVERRGAGETGTARVEYLEGDAAWTALRDGSVPRDLFDAAIASLEETAAEPMETACPQPMVFLIEYRDGLRGACVLLNGFVHDFAFAGRIDGRLEACEVYLQRDFPHGHFNYLCLNIEEMVVTGRPAWPVERTLLTTGITDALLRSRHAGRGLDTPWLGVEYQAPATIPYRPTGPRPTGSNLDPWPPAG